MAEHEIGLISETTGGRRPRVVMVSANAYPAMGGVETHVHEVAPRIARMGFDVTVLTTDRSGRLAPREVVDGVRTIRVPAWPRERDYYFAPRIARLVAHGGWDLVHCQGYHTLVPPLAMTAAISARIPYVLTFHSGGHPSALRTRLRGIQRALMRPLLARADHLIAVSEYEAELFMDGLRLPASRFSTIYNGATMEVPDDAAALSDEAPVVLSVGRLERFKGHHRLIDAFPTVLREVPGARLRIVGAGQYEAELRRMAAEAGLDGTVEIGAIDPVDRAGMARALAGASLVALLSEYEANPIAVMEALALRRRVLVADTSGLSELGRRGLARAIPIDASGDDVARAILEQLRTAPPGELDLPTWDQTAARITQVYREVLGR